MNQPCYPATERNRAPIADVLRDWLDEAGLVLEIGSGSGQHAVYFGELFPHLIWQTSDLAVNHAGILSWLQAAKLDNVRSPLELNVVDRPWPISDADAIYASNCTHIMLWSEVIHLLAGAAESLRDHGRLILYGAFRFSHIQTAPSNDRFDAQLQAQNPGMGLRDFTAINRQAQAAGLEFESLRELPANNFMLLWRRLAR